MVTQQGRQRALKHRQTGSGTMSGSVRKPRIFPLGDMTGAQNYHKPRFLTDLPTSSTGAAILATEAIVVIAHPRYKDSKHDSRANGITNESNFISLIGNDQITIYSGKNHNLLPPIWQQKPQDMPDLWVRALRHAWLGPSGQSSGFLPEAQGWATTIVAPPIGPSAPSLLPGRRGNNRHVATPSLIEGCKNSSNIARVLTPSRGGECDKCL